MARTDVGFGTPFDAQIQFLKNKLNLPTATWQDIENAAHDRAFVVAGAAKADLLTDLHKSMNDAVTSGGGLKEFRKSFADVVKTNGWTGWTGEGTASGEAWRTKVIYQTNMATSYAAGRYQQLMEPKFLKLRPFWRYIHSDGAINPRPQHVAWHGLTLPYDHPFWQTHFPPCGWGCQCRVTAVSAKEGAASANAGLSDPPKGWDVVDPATGAPVGVDKGFAYTPGASDLSLAQMVQAKMINYPPAIAQALAADINLDISATGRASAFVKSVLGKSASKRVQWLGFVDDAGSVGAAAGVDVTTGYVVLLPSSAVPSGVADAGIGKTRAVLADDFDLVQQVLSAPDTLVAGPTTDGEPTVVATKQIGSEVYRAVFVVGVGDKQLRLLSLSIST